MSIHRITFLYGWGDSRTVLIYQDLDMKAPNGKAYRDKARVSGGYLYLTYRTVTPPEEADTIWL